MNGFIVAQIITKDSLLWVLPVVGQPIMCSPGDFFVERTWTCVAENVALLNNLNPKAKAKLSGTRFMLGNMSQGTSYVDVHTSIPPCIGLSASISPPKSST